jgi:hypothetical protein
MVSIIWAFGSMLVMMLIISFLPLGITLKGKFIVVSAGFVLALGGLASVSTFPLWTTLVLLLVLSFFAAYMMDNRLGKFLYSVELHPEEEMIETPKLPFSQEQNNSDNLDFLDLTEIDSVPSFSKQEEKLDSEDNLSPIQPEILLNKPFYSEDEDDEISFLQEKNEDILFIEESKDNEADELELGYLSEIESLLLEESEAVKETEEEGWLNELSDLPSEDNLEETNGDENLLEELYIASKEVAADKEITKEDTPLKKLEFQK